MIRVMVAREYWVSVPATPRHVCSICQEKIYSGKRWLCFIQVDPPKLEDMVIKKAKVRLCAACFEQLPNRDYIGHFEVE